MVSLIIFLAIGWGIYRSVKRKGGLEGAVAALTDGDQPEEKKRGVRWLIAAVITANFAQATLKQATHTGSISGWVLGGVWLLGMGYCMWRSWQYLYLGRKTAPLSQPHRLTPTQPPSSHATPKQQAPRSTRQQTAGTLHAANHPSPTGHVQKKPKDKQFQQL